MERNFRFRNFLNNQLRWWLYGVHYFYCRSIIRTLLIKVMNMQQVGLRGLTNMSLVPSFITVVAEDFFTALSYLCRGNTLDGDSRIRAWRRARGPTQLARGISMGAPRRL